MRVLVVEDHAKLAMTLAAGLRRAGMAVDVAFDGDDALERLAVTAYDVVVLDRDIPGTHGDDVCKVLVAGGSSSRVLMLTAAGAVEDRVEGLGIGADDWPRPASWCRPKNSSNGSGTRQLTLSVRRSGPPSAACGPSSATRPSLRQ